MRRSQAGSNGLLRASGKGFPEYVRRSMTLRQQMSAYDSLGRFSGYFISNKKGNTITFDALGNFDGYVVQDENLLKFDKAGNYQGYYEIKKDGNIAEYECSGKYKGIYMGVKTKKITKYDELGRPVLFIVSE